MLFFPSLLRVTNLQRVSGRKLWLIMLCSWSSASTSSVTLFGCSLNCSMIASLVGFARVEKNPWHNSVSPCFILNPHEAFFI